MKANISPARTGAYKILCDVFVNGAFSNISVNKNVNVLKNESDRRLAVQIVYGAIKKKNRLDKIISTLSDAKLSNIDDRVHVILAMSVFQLFYLDRLPEYAVVNDAVNMSKFYAGNSTGSFVNGVLRSAIRKKETLTKYEEDFEKRMFFDYGISEFVLGIFRKSYGDDSETESFAKSSEQAPGVFLRVNTLRTSAEKLISEFEKIRVQAELTYVPGVIRILSGVNVFSTPMYKSGHFYAQDISGAIAGYILNPKGGESVLDICAAPGGKSFSAAILSLNSGVTACDINARRLELLKRSAIQMGLAIRALKRDARYPKPDEIGKYDKIICDVPCSGLGVIGRKPEILYNLTKEHVSDLIELQKEILRSAFAYLKAGGELVYSTCTINIDENENIVRDFIENTDDALPAPIQLGFALMSGHAEIRDGMLRLSPVRDGCDGFFAAKIQKVKR